LRFAFEEACRRLVQVLPERSFLRCKRCATHAKERDSILATSPALYILPVSTFVSLFERLLAIWPFRCMDCNERFSAIYQSDGAPITCSFEKMLATNGQILLSFLSKAVMNPSGLFFPRI
jgi:hypothetical protein